MPTYSARAPVNVMNRLSEWQLKTEMTDSMADTCSLSLMEFKWAVGKTGHSLRVGENKELCRKAEKTFGPPKKGACSPLSAQAEDTFYVHGVP